MLMQIKCELSIYSRMRRLRKTLRILRKALHILRNRHQTRKNTKRYRCTRKGGNYKQSTEMMRNGIPVEKDTIITIPGQPPMTIKEFDEYMSQQYNRSFD